jgi:hypothetical protein
VILTSVTCFGNSKSADNSAEGRSTGIQTNSNESAFVFDANGICINFTGIWLD